MIAVPSLETGAADEGAVELARMLTAAGHRAIVASRGGRLEQGVAAAGAQQVKNALLHHVRGFIREGDCENGVARNALFEQVRHAIRDDASFAGARTRQDKQRTFGSEHGFALAFVQRIQKSHGKVRSTQGNNSI